MMKNPFSLFQNDSLAERYTVFYLLNISDLYVSSDGLIYSKYFFSLSFLFNFEASFLSVVQSGFEFTV